MSAQKTEPERADDPAPPGPAPREEGEVFRRRADELRAMARLAQDRSLAFQLERLAVTWEDAAERAERQAASQRQSEAKRISPKR